ncbi:MAG: hypothetical protein GVY14_03840 [Spirochaetes bacterium]|jgi:hypothetical protein|nr:hypothetical protein [Spirochaetota bacterium]
MAVEMGILKAGTVSIDGTHIKANFGKYKNIRYDRITELEQQLDADIAELLTEAEAADERDDDDGQRLPTDISRGEALQEKPPKRRKKRIEVSRGFSRRSL